MDLQAVQQTAEQIPIPNPVPHLLAGGGIVATILGILPQLVGVVAAVVAMCYYSICMWESRTVQHWYNNRKLVQKAKRVARIRAEQKVLLAELEALEVVREARALAVEKVEAAKAEAAKMVVKQDAQAIIDPHDIPTNGHTPH